MLRVGLTGNIASGKSCAAAMFAAMGAYVIDADRIGHELLARGSATAARVIDAFGHEIISPDGSIDRRKLGSIVFWDEEKRLLLNRLMHPYITAEIRQRVEEVEKMASSGIIIVDAALMVETGNYKWYDCLIVVTCDPALQIERLMRRDKLSEQEARARIAAQMPIEEKLKLADYRIDTSGTLDQTRRQVEAIYRDLLRQKERDERRGQADP